MSNISNNNRWHSICNTMFCLFKLIKIKTIFFLASDVRYERNRDGKNAIDKYQLMANGGILMY